MSGTVGSWDFPGADTQYLTHGLHPYLASMIPQLPARLLEEYAPPGTRVLDPFVGGGGVLVEAYLRGLPSMGIDVNPLAALICRAKTTPIPATALAQAQAAFERIVPRVHPEPPSFPREAGVEYWFKPAAFEPLARIRGTMDAVVDETDPTNRSALSNLLRCIFSNTVRDVSLTYRGEVRLRRLRGQDLERFNPDVLDAWRTRMRDGFGRVRQLPPCSSLPQVLEGDCRRIPAEEGAFHLTITSPPYGDMKNTIPYHYFSRNMLYWLGMGDAAMRTMKRDGLGAKDGAKSAPASPSLASALAGMSKPNLRHEAVCFYADYLDALREIARVTSDRIVIVIGHRILDGVVVDNPAITTELMELLGWRLEAWHQRTIRKKRIHRKMGFGHNAQGGTIDREAILVYVK